MITYHKHRKGTWRILSDDRLTPGQVVEVLAPGGEMVTATIDRIIWAGDDFTLADDLPRKCENGGTPHYGPCCRLGHEQGKPCLCSCCPLG